MAPGAVLITGAASGIGRACVLRLDRLGFRVFAGVRKQEDAGALRAAASPRVTPLLLDVADAGAIQAAVAAVTAAVGPAGLAGLVNNAGIATAGPLEFLPVSVLRQTLEINVVSQAAVTQAFLPLLRAARGRIINMGSVSGRLALPFMGPYAASKFALSALTDSLRVELAPWGIHVASVDPGTVATPIWQKGAALAEAYGLPPEADRLYGKALAGLRETAVALGRSGIPAERVAAAVEHALTAPRPRTRYTVAPAGRIWMVRLLRALPDRLRDRLVLRSLR